MLRTQTETGIVSVGYQIQIVMKADAKRLKCLETIAEEYGYAIRNDFDNWLVTIYEPAEKEKIKIADDGEA